MPKVSECAALRDQRFELGSARLQLGSCRIGRQLSRPNNGATRAPACNPTVSHSMPLRHHFSSLDATDMGSLLAPLGVIQRLPGEGKVFLGQ